MERLFCVSAVDVFKVTKKFLFVVKETEIPDQQVS